MLELLNALALNRLRSSKLSSIYVVFVDIICEKQKEIMSSMSNIYLLERCLSSENFAQAEPALEDVAGHRHYPLYVRAITGSEELSWLFKRACCCSQGLSEHYLQIVVLRERCRALFQESSATYRDVLLPLLMRSLQCHQTALSQFGMGQKDTARQAMAETGDVAQRLEPSYEKLANRWAALGKSTGELFVAMSQEETSMLIQAKAINGLDKALLKARASALAISIRSLFSIKAVFENIRITWRMAEFNCGSCSLGNPGLADPVVIEALESEGDAADGLIAIAEKAFGCAPPQKADTCKATSFLLPGGSVEDRSFLQLIKSELSGGIPETFEKSCSKWLELGMVSQKMAQLADRAFD